ncbi:hypothetical protein CY34DRAFT_809406 [Suillus luteus UH-Slu-Lm8-n1]|uniref:Uncharacterized protein n=1 Tax=Suillus luteus UH-Slu-Lm8-n1 TaxID=930992 RepID=A0A0D0B3B2_9AGAM|nr:hypothetical protein CY34DRAFT_809406 [Suillus luteus UH-Slu-Lm8-n1]
MQNTGQICILLSMNVRVKHQPNKHACIHTPVGIDHSRSKGKQMITSKFSITFHDDLLSVSKPRRLINTCTPVECLAEHKDEGSKIDRYSRRLRWLIVHCTGLSFVLAEGKRK